MIEEVWKPVNIEGYEGLYEISNLARVKALERPILLLPLGRVRPERIMKQALSTHGYFYVRLHNNSKTKHMSVHRLVALAFIPNPKNKPCINHKNSIRTDNSVENLEWCTYSENNIHSMRVGNKKPVGSKDVLNVETGIFYSSITDAAYSINKEVSNISHAIRGTKHKNYTAFILLDDSQVNYSAAPRNYSKGRIVNKKTVLNTATGVFYDSIADAALSANICRTKLVQKLNGTRKNKTSFIYA